MAIRITTYYVNMGADFENEEQIECMENKHKLKIVDITKFQIEHCKSKNEVYAGPNVYMFLGNWENIVNYFLWDYALEDIDALQELVKDIRPIEI